jgi:hypothetical protein
MSSEPTYSKQWEKLGVAQTAHSSDEEDSKEISEDEAFQRAKHYGLKEFKNLFEGYHDPEHGWPRTVAGDEKKGRFNAVRLRPKFATMDSDEFGDHYTAHWQDELIDVLAGKLNEAAEKRGLVLDMPDSEELFEGLSQMAEISYKIVDEMCLFPRHEPALKNMSLMVSCIFQRFFIDFLIGFASTTHFHGHGCPDYQQGGSISYKDLYCKAFRYSKRAKAVLTYQTFTSS